jgi:hypothetical protein
MGNAVRGTKIGAIVLLVMGCLMLLVELQSPSHDLWTDTHVAGYSQGGLIYYKYKGETYTTDNPYQDATDSRRIPKTVYFDPDNPAAANLHGNTRWLDAFVVLVWFVGAGVLLLVGTIRERRRRKRRPAVPGIYDPGGSLFSK